MANSKDVNNKQNVPARAEHSQQNGHSNAASIAADTAQAQGPSAADIKTFIQVAQSLEKELSSIVVGQERVIRELLLALLAGGHVLLEGVPGLGKTLLVRTLADALALKFARIQLTPDLMPAAIGVPRAPPARRYRRHHHRNRGVRQQFRRQQTRLQLPAQPHLRQHRAGRRSE